MTPIEAINAIAAHRLDIHFHRPERGKISVWSEEQRERVYAMLHEYPDELSALCGAVEMWVARYGEPAHEEAA